MDLEPITEADLRLKLLAVDRTSEEKLLGAHGHQPELAQWAEEHGYEIVGYVFENGINGATPVTLRDDLINAMRRLRDEPDLHGVIWRSTDRQARDHHAFEAILYTLWWLRKRLYVGTVDDAGRLTFTDIVPTETRLERRKRRLREMDAERARTLLLIDADNARRAKMARGGNGGGYLQPPWFMDRVDLGNGRSEFAPNPERVQWALWMRDRNQQGWSYGRIGRELDRHGITTATGGQWRRDAVSRVLQQLAAIPPDIQAAWFRSIEPARRDMLVG